MNNTYDEIQIDPGFEATTSVELDKHTEKLKTALFEQMKNKGVTAIRVEFAGGGDSGQIENILFTGMFKEEIPSLEELKTDVLSIEVRQGSTHVGGKWVPNMITKTISNLKELAEETFYSVDAAAELDWSNNDGGQGHMIFYHDGDGDHVQFLVQVNYTSHEDYYIGVK